MGDVFGIGAAVQGGTALAGAGIQAAAINRATDAQQQAANNALDFSKQQYNTQQQQLQPFYGAGTQALSALSNGLYNGALATFDPHVDTTYHSPGDATNIQYQNQAFNPNSVDVTQDPGYQFRLQQGLQALQRSQAATGLSGGAAAKAINDYAQGSASQEYGNAYQRALSTYGANTQNAQNQFSDTLGAYQAQVGNSLNQSNSALQNQSNAYNRLYQMSGIGQNAAAGLGQAGQAAVQQQNSITTQLGNALSAGSAAQGNVWGNAVNQGGNAINSYLTNRAVNG